MEPSGLSDEEFVKVLAAAADLPLAPGRTAVVATILRAWIDEANELSRKMSAREHAGLLPATIFLHPGSGS